MGSLGGGEAVRRRKAMWLYPKVMGFHPPERWGHSACLYEGIVYVFGGCCGGLHFSDVLTLNLETMAWSSIATSGQRPGTRDSHSAVVVGHKMLVLGGTNGTKKVNDLHILDLKTMEWSKPSCKGIPPTPRESHTTTLVGEDRLVIFGGSGEGETNYLNDVHILDLNTMTWTSPEVKGDPPAPRDSHIAVAIGSKLLLYGGDCGDHYHGEVDVLDTETMCWCRLMVQGSSPGVRAGHAAVTLGTKVYIIGGVGDKQYYNDVWILDVANCAWSQLDTRGQQPQGRFSHAAIIANADIAIYGGCGEDERPLSELLILQLGSEHQNGRFNISMCKIFGGHWAQEKKKFLRADVLRNAVLKNGESNRRELESEAEAKGSIFRNSDDQQEKRRRVNGPKIFDIESSEPEEHSVSLSQHSSPSQSDQEQNAAQMLSSFAKGHGILLSQPQIDPLNSHGMHESQGEFVKRPKIEQFLRPMPQKHEIQSLISDQKPPSLRPGIPPLIGADVIGTIDGAFDSGYLMTATVNGQILRGVLFAPGPGVAVPRPLACPHKTVPVPKQCSTPAHAIPIHVRPPVSSSQHNGFIVQECGGHHVRNAHPAKVVKAQPARLNSDLQGVVLTLGGPGGGNHSGT